MTPKQIVEYLRTNISKWNQIIEKLDDDDTFINVCNYKITAAKEKISNIIKKESPEDFLK